MKLHLQVCMALALLLTNCGSKENLDPLAGAPPPTKVEKEADANVVKVDHPERFPLATATAYDSAPSLNVTGQVAADVSRTVPVISLASGRVIEVRARLGDEVKKGQLLVRVRSTDVSTASGDYRKGQADEALAKAQLERARILYEKGAMAHKDLELAQDVEAKAKVDVETARERLAVLGAGMGASTGVVDITAPISGVITEQNVVNAAGVKTLDNSPNLFTIADLSSVWILCDVYENQLPFVRIGEYADVRVPAYPNEVLHARVGNIGSSLDSNIRTAKVRLEVRNSGRLRIGMFANAIFHGQKKELHASVPASAVLHLHDRDWVYVQQASGEYRRTEVASGEMLPGNMQEIRAGLEPGKPVVKNALVLQSSVEQ